MRRNWVGILLVLVLFAALLPMGVLAFEPEDVWLEESDVGVFMEAAVSGGKDMAGNRLEAGSLERAVYEELKRQITAVAADGGSTVFDISECFASFTMQDFDYDGCLLQVGDDGLPIESNELLLKEEVQADIIKKLRFDETAVMTALLLDCPYEFYWFREAKNGADGSYDGVESHAGYSASGDEYTVEITPQVTVTLLVAAEYQNGGGTEVRANTSVVQDMAREAIAQNSGLSDEARLTAYKDWLCGQTANAASQARTDMPLLDVFGGSMAGASYAKAFQYLCNLTQFQGKVDCYTVSGIMDGVPRMWNIVRIDGQSYLVDVASCTAYGGNGLFLNGAVSQSEDGVTVQMRDGGTTCVYVYDEGVPWESWILTLAAENYGPAPASIELLLDGRALAEDAVFTVALGGHADFTARVLDVDGEELKGAEVVWSLSGDTGLEPSGISVENGTVAVSTSAKAPDTVWLTASVKAKPSIQASAGIQVVYSVLSGEIIMLDQDRFTYTGSEWSPSVLIGGETPEEAGCTVAYSENQNAGTAYVTVTAQEGSRYSGTAVKAFTIVKAGRDLRVAPAVLTLDSIESVGTLDAIFADVDGSARPVFALDAAGQGVAVLTDTGGTARVEAVGSGTTTVTVTIPETDNYNASALVICTIEVRLGDSAPAGEGGTVLFPPVPPADGEASTDPVPPTDTAFPSRPSSGGFRGNGRTSVRKNTVSVRSSANGSISLSKESAVAGEQITVTVKANRGYVLDSLRILDKDGQEVRLQESGGRYVFTMPAGNVEIDASFRKEEENSALPAFPFADAADSWARDAIAWAYERGYVNGTSPVTFDPDGGITRQQMWMILARFNGQAPAGMAEARAWAMENGITDGSNSGGALSRQQLVAFLCRCAQLEGYTVESSADISGYPDSGDVSAYAREPLAWAVGSGIITGTSAGTLDPTGGATRAQFAVILQRFYNHITAAD